MPTPNPIDNDITSSDFCQPKEVPNDLPEAQPDQSINNTAIGSYLKNTYHGLEENRQNVTSSADCKSEHQNEACPLPHSQSPLPSQAQSSNLERFLAPKKRINPYRTMLQSPLFENEQEQEPSPERRRCCTCTLL